MDPLGPICFKNGKKSSSVLISVFKNALFSFCLFQYKKIVSYVSKTATKANLAKVRTGSCYVIPFIHQVQARPYLARPEPANCAQIAKSYKIYCREKTNITQNNIIIQSKHPCPCIMLYRFKGIFFICICLFLQHF